jgi:hypothetical protein
MPTPTSGCRERRALATRMPSSSPDGGIRTSVITTCGASRSTACSSAPPSSQIATTSTSASRDRTFAVAYRIR